MCYFSAGAVATLITYPFDVCRTIFAARGVAEQPLKEKSRTFAPPKTLYEFAYSLYHKRGVRAFYAGYSPALVQIMPYMGLNFCIYEKLTKNDKRSIATSGFAGSISGALSKVVVYPIDTIKKRLQAQAVFGSAGQDYSGMWDCFNKMLRNEGPTSFYRGLVPSVAKTAIATSLTFSLYRGTKNILEDFHRSSIAGSD